MSFLGQLNFGYPITSHNIITDIPDNAVLPLSIGSSLQGNTLGVTFGDLKSQVTPAGPIFTNDNTPYGSEALANVTIGEGNTGIGYGALMLNTTGDTNVAVGYRAMLNNTTGYRNVGIGSGSLLNNTTGAQNVAIGQAALNYNTTGTDNVGIGYATDSGNFNGSVLLGKAATATGNNQLVIGSSTNNVGAIATETITSNRTWTVRINGANYKIPMIAI